MAKGSKAAAKGAGKVKAGAKALEGYPGILRHLVGEHAEVSSLMKRVAGSQDDSDVREELFPEIRKSLLAHAKAEEKEFYPVLQEFDETRDLVAKAESDHDKVEQYLAELDSGNKHTATWLEVFERMQRAVESHVDEEENQIFPIAKDLLSRDQANDILERYEATEEREKQRL